MSTQYSRPPRTVGEVLFNFVLCLAAIAALLLLVLYGAVALAALVTGNSVPSASDYVAAVADGWPNPVAGFTEPVGHPVLVYALFALLLGGLGFLVWKVSFAILRRMYERRTGKTSTRDLKGMQRKSAELAASKALERSLEESAMANTNPVADGDAEPAAPVLATDIPLVIAFGTYQSVELFLQHEDSVSVIAPARSGKTNSIAVPLILDAPGPVLATGTKADILLLTAVMRQAIGKVLAFDPSGVANWPYKARPDFVHGCEDPEEALDRAKSWAAGSNDGDSAGNAGWFRARAAEVLAYFLHAAAIKEGGSLKDVMLWAADFSNEEPLNLLRKSPYVREAGWPEKLRSRTQSRAAETTDSLATTLQGILAPLDSPRILEWLCPPPEERFDLVDFIEGNGTLYLLTGKGGVTVAPVLTMFHDLVIRTAQNLSQTKPGERLWPPLRQVLDEAAHVAPMPTLPEIMADSGGRGITTVVLNQSKPQMESRWGKQESDTIRANATATVYLPGIKEHDLLEELSDAMDRYRSARLSSDSRGGYSTSSEWDKVMTPGEIRQMQVGTGLVFYRNLKGAVVTFMPWWDRPDAKEIRAAFAEAKRITGSTLPEPRPGVDPHPADIITEDVA